jgi:hypothetical protein
MSAKAPAAFSPYRTVRQVSTSAAAAATLVEAKSIRLANALSTHFGATSDKSLPPRDEIFFYLTTSAGVYRAIATEAALQDGSDPLVGLGGAMQRIVTEYRLRYKTSPVIH